MRVAIGCDHIVTDIKNELYHFLLEQGYDVVDCGTYDNERTHYPIYGLRVARAVVTGEAQRGIVICGTGVGITASASKVAGVRAILTRDVQGVRHAVERYDVNVLGMGGRIVGMGLMQEIALSFLTSSYEPDANEVAYRDALMTLQQGVDLPEENEFEAYLKRWDEEFYHD